MTKTAAYMGFAIVGLKNIGSTLVFQFCCSARARRTEFYCPTIAKPKNGIASKPFRICPIKLGAYHGYMR